MKTKYFNSFVKHQHIKTTHMNAVYFGKIERNIHSNKEEEEYMYLSKLI